MKILVTGASRGIGRAICEQLVNGGHRVIGTSREPDSIEDALSGVSYIGLDLSSEISIQRCAESVGEIDVLVNNAGCSQFGPVECIDSKSLRKLFEINFFGTVALTKEFLPTMLERKQGKIINMGSLLGHFNLPYYSSYAATKHALKAHTSCLRQEVQCMGIDVHLVDPYDTNTDIEREFICNSSSKSYAHARNMLSNIEARVAKGVPPSVVGQKVVHIINHGHSAFSLPVGGLGPALLLLKRILPQRIEEIAVRYMYKL